MKTVSYVWSCTGVYCGESCTFDTRDDVVTSMHRHDEPHNHQYHTDESSGIATVEAYTITISKVVTEVETLEVLIVPEAVAPAELVDDHSTFTCHCGVEMSVDEYEDHSC